MTAKKRAGGKTKKTAKAKAGYWSAGVMRKSNALDIEEGAFSLDDPQEIARSLKRSAEASTRRKAGPYQSAMSMLNFYINRAGKNLPARRKKILEQAKAELRKLYGRDEGPPPAPSPPPRKSAIPPQAARRRWR